MHAEFPYLIPHLLPAYEPHLLCGASGAGKTTLLLQILRDFLDGKPILGEPHDGGTLGYLAGDRTVTSYKEKFMLMGVRPFPIVGMVDHPQFDTARLRNAESRLDMMRSILDQLHNPTVVVFDPIGLFLGARNLNDYMQVAEAMLPISRLCLERKITIIGTHHATKLKEATKFNRLQDRANGSGALLGFTGTQMFLTDHTEIADNPNKVYHLLVNPHNHPAREFKFVRSGEGGMFQPYTDADEQFQASLDNAPLLQLIPTEGFIPTTTLVRLAAEMMQRGERSIYRDLDSLVTVGLARKTREGYTRGTPN